MVSTQGDTGGESVLLSVSLSLESKTAFIAHERSSFGDMERWTGVVIVGDVVVEVWWLVESVEEGVIEVVEVEVGVFRIAEGQPALFCLVMRGRHLPYRSQIGLGATGECILGVWGGVVVEEVVGVVVVGELWEIVGEGVVGGVGVVVVVVGVVVGGLFLFARRRHLPFLSQIGFDLPRLPAVGGEVCVGGMLV